ncbi:hypothetical protein [uncultured Tateyamaria sp.]|uniref:GNAT family N-acetyltransferase n=1 Tax=uncultured Tateyamaria sp. TaxID=455651 RepID=UPI00261BDCD8|nr:hypothetical protein [uncultured Tateyamaria sp.]
MNEHETTDANVSGAAKDKALLAEGGNVISCRMANRSDDLAGILALAHEAHHESRFQNICFSVEKATRLAIDAFENPKQNGVMVALRGNKQVGFAHCSVGEYFIGTGALLTTVHVLYVSQQVRQSLAGGRCFLGLLAGLESWSRNRGSSQLLLHVTGGIEANRTSRSLARTGYAPVGSNFAKPLNRRNN